MPLNPNIILGVRPIQVEQADPLERYAKIVGLQGARGQQELQAMQLGEARRAADVNERLRALYASNPKATAEEVMAIDPKTGMAVRKTELEALKTQAGIDKDAATAAKTRRDMDIANLERGAAVLASAKDQASYESAIRFAVMNGFIKPEAAQQFPPQFDPNIVRQIASAGMTRAQQLADERAREGQAITMRGQDISAQTAREGHGVTMRGQNIAASTAIRGQNLTDARARELAEITRQNKEDKTTDTERVSAGYATRMVQSGKIMDELEKKGVGRPEIAEAMAGNAPIGAKVGANLMASPDRQKYRQAQEDWVRAKLRKESGAVIADEEMDREIRVYFPQIGDSDVVKRQKAQSRKVAEQAMVQAAGKAKVDTGTTGATGGWAIKPIP